MDEYIAKPFELVVARNEDGNRLPKATHADFAVRLLTLTVDRDTSRKDPCSEILRSLPPAPPPFALCEIGRTYRNANAVSAHYAPALWFACVCLFFQS